MNLSRCGQTAIIVTLIVCITAAHYGTDVHAGDVHEFLQRAYYLPVVLAGLWFGLRGGLLAAFVISTAFFMHALHGWHGSSSFFYRMSEMVMFHIVGGLTGFLSGRIRAALDAETRQRVEKQNAYERLRVQTNELFTLEEQLRRSDRLAALGRLTMGLAHEIRNPLASIRTSAECLRDAQQAGGIAEGAAGGAGEKEGDVPDFHGVILEETERLNRILTDFLQFARQEKEEPAQGWATCDAWQAVAGVRGLLAPQLAQRGIELRLSGAKEGCEVRIDESLLRQALLNLALNALDALEGMARGEGEEKKAWIAIEIGAQGDAAQGDAGMVSIVVQDSGPGISAGLAPRVFDPFVSSREGGTGLGLSIVERIIASAGGAIRLDTERMPSSRFVITLPGAKHQI